jgi:hypothetical protein
VLASHVSSRSPCTAHRAPLPLSLPPLTLRADRLFLITQISKRVCAATAAEAAASASDGGAESADVAARQALSRFFPPLLWLLRDFVLELSDGNGGTLTSDAYMEYALEARNKGQRRADERNDTRAAIRELFGRRSCATLVRPAADEASLRHAVSGTALRPEFLEQMERVRSSVLREAPLKKIFGEQVDGQPSPVSHRPSALALRPWPFGPRLSALALRPSPFGPRPSAIALRPSPSPHPKSSPGMGSSAS